MCDNFGRPKWWRHYVYGLAWIGREQLRNQLHTAQAVRLGQDNKEFVDWQRDTLRIIQAQVGTHG